MLSPLHREGKAADGHVDVARGVTTARPCFAAVAWVVSSGREGLPGIRNHRACHLMDGRDPWSNAQFPRFDPSAKPPHVSRVSATAERILRHEGLSSPRSMKDMRPATRHRESSWASCPRSPRHLTESSSTGTLSPPSGDNPTCRTRCGAGRIKDSDITQAKIQPPWIIFRSGVVSKPWPFERGKLIVTRKASK